MDDNKANIKNKKPTGIQKMGPLPGNLPKESLVKIISKKEPGENTKYLKAAMAALDLEPIDCTDPEQVDRRMREYFINCAENDMKPTVAGMSSWLGIERTSLWKWRTGGGNRASSKKSRVIGPVIQRYMDAIEDMHIGFMMDNKVAPATGIFLAKNFFGYRDQQEVAITPNNPMGDDISEEELQKRIVEGLAEDDYIDGEFEIKE